MPAEDQLDVVDREAESRFTLTSGGAVAELVYDLDGNRLLLLHTGVPEAFRGQGVGGRLVTASVDKAVAEGLTIVPWCPYARRWLQDHGEVASRVEVDFDTPPPAE